MNSRSQIPAPPTANPAEPGAYHAPLAIRPALARAGRPGTPAAEPRPAAAPERHLVGAAAVNHAALVATTHPASHPDPDAELAALVADIKTLPPERRAALRTVVAGMLRKANDAF